MLTPPLSLQLREGTQDSHRTAESTPFIRVFFSGKLSISQYRNFLLQLFHIYSALEENPEVLYDDPELQKIYFPELFRSLRLSKDLNLFFGKEDWKSIPILQTTQEYADRIRFLKDQRNYALVAHHYTRYLGDLSGGQAMKKIVLKMFPEEYHTGISFYEFPEISNFDDFKNEYRSRLDSLSIDVAVGQSMIQEARLAFQFNTKITGSLLE
ncbi:MAG: biliverdin-producing heme oxygenase [Anaerolineaceae bacterium]